MLMELAKEDKDIVVLCSDSRGSGSMTPFADEMCIRDSYYIDSEYPEELTGKYLYTYGLLQALYLMEDAIDTISQTLCGKRVNFMTDYPQAYRVREMRNDVVGHPINRRGESSVRLIQLSLSKKGFEYNKFNFSAL